MKILVAGGTGFIGRYLCWRLAEAGHDVLVLTRRLRQDAAAVPRQAFWDGATAAPSWLAAAAECPAWINLCGEGVADARWSAARKKALTESRLGPTRTLVSALAQVPKKPRVLINASAVGYYGDTGDRTTPEAAAPGKGFLAQLCAAWENEAQRASESGVRVVCLRLGAVLGREGGILARLAPLFRLGLGGPLGNGKQWLSWISREDLAGLVEHLLKAEVSGAVNAVAPKPATNLDFSRTLGRVLERPARFRVPGLVLQLALGEMASMLLTGQRASAKKALDAGYVFKKPDLEAVLREELL